MRILVIGDTHGNTENILDIMHDLAGRLDAVIHLGDIVSDAEIIKSVPVHTVAGNCDKNTSAPDEDLLEAEGKLIYITHGHLFNVNYSTKRIEERAKELNADVCLFGHTHIPYLNVDHGHITMNPGSLSEPRGGSQAGYGILKIENGKIIPMLLPYIV